MVTLNRSIGSNADLGTREGDGDLYTLAAFGDCWLGADSDSSIWVRFPNITIPAGATIDVAYIVFDVPYVEDSGTIQSNIFGIDEDDHAAPTNGSQWSTDHGIHTTATTVWDFSTGSGATRQTPSIVGIIQEIVDRGGWASGNDIGIHVDDDNSNSATIAFDGATLHVEYTEGGETQDLTGAAFTVSPSFGTHTVDPEYDLTGNVFQISPTFGTGLVETGPATLTGTVFEVSPNFGDHTVEPGAVTVTGTVFTVSPSFGDPTVTAEYDLAGTVFQVSPSFGEHTITPGAAAVTGTVFQVSPSFGEHTVGISGFLAGQVLQVSPSFGAHTVTPGAVTVVGAAFQVSPAFGSGSVFEPVVHGTGDTAVDADRAETTVEIDPSLTAVTVNPSDTRVAVDQWETDVTVDASHTSIDLDRHDTHVDIDQLQPTSA